MIKLLLITLFAGAGVHDFWNRKSSSGFAFKKTSMACGLIAAHDAYILLSKNSCKKTYAETSQQRNDAITQNPKLLKYASLEKEANLPSLETIGTIPKWINGALIRNGAGKFETTKHHIMHPFDGFGMLHKFVVKNGNVSYQNKFIDSHYYRTGMTTGEVISGFSSKDKSTIIGDIINYRKNQKNLHSMDNPNVHVAFVGGKLIAMNETPQPSIAINVNTLASEGSVLYNDNIKGQIGLAHIHTDPLTGDVFNILTHFAKDSSYNIHRIRPDGKRLLVASIAPAHKSFIKKPSYTHSFSISEHYLVMTEIPFTVNPLNLMLLNKPFIQSFSWEPKRGTIFTIINKETGSIVGRIKGEPFFTFHHVNCYEKDNNLILDVVVHDNCDVIESLEIDGICKAALNRSSEKQKTSHGRIKRFTINLSTNSIESTLIFDGPLEMPTINYDKNNGKEYRYAYGISTMNPQVIKVDTTTKKTMTWHDATCVPSEAVFVQNPENTDEDGGVLLSVVLDTKKKQSFLLVLDAKTMTEVARSYVPHHIPFNLHGNFFQVETDWINK